MKKIILFLIVCCVLVFLFRCEGRAVHVTGDFYATEVDSKEDRRLSRVAGENAYVGVLPPMVVATWTDGKVIITKQHPTGEFHRPNYSCIQYYIVLIGEDKFGLNDSIIGPLSDYELKQEQKKLGLPSKVKFNQIN